MRNSVEASKCSQENVRNICILAHVDHGKTTCADNLVASNGIISRQSAGKIRYMDSREDEQQRQITMKSSAIGLHWSPGGSDDIQKTHLVNLIDSPGHVDFTSEVSTAARLADGALVVVDVVEGVEAQTRTVLRQAWRDRVKTCLFLNKIDRLIVELEMTPMEAYQRLVRILEQVNAVNQQLLSEDIMARDAEETAEVPNGPGTEGIDLTADNLLEFDTALEEDWRYSPEKGNVAFGSGTHCWAFRIDTFAKLIAAKMGAKPENLQRVLWGDWAFNPRTKLASRRTQQDSKTKPMVVQFVFEQLWKVYDVTYKAVDVEQLKKMQTTIPGWKGLNFESATAGQALTRELFAKWLPFADCVLQMIVNHTPSPIQAARGRLPALCPRWFATADTLTRAGAEQEDIAQSLRLSDTAGTVVVYLAKFLAADLERLVLTGDTLIGDENVCFVAMCRVFSGTLVPGQCVHVMKEEGSEERILRVQRIFRLMGRNLEELVAAPSGSIVALEVIQPDVEDGSSSLGELGVQRCLTLCSVADGPCFETPYSSQAFAIVRVSLEPHHISDLDGLYRGLRLLHKADPSVHVETMVTGENVLGCCGDEHLKRCITDLQNLYAKNIPLRISQPLVAVRESIAPSILAERAELALKNGALWLPMWASHLLEGSTEASSQLSTGHSEHEDVSDAGVQNHQMQDRISMSSAGIMSFWTANRRACIMVSCVALPDGILNWMEDRAEDLESVVHRQRASAAFAKGGEITLSTCLQEIAQQIKDRLASEVDDDENENSGSLVELTLSGMSVAKGSRTLLFDATDSPFPLAESYKLGGTRADSSVECHPGANVQGSNVIPAWMRPSLLAGFQFASSAGPLCEEPMRGVAFILHRCIVVGAAEEAGNASEGYMLSATPASLTMADPYGPMSGQVLQAMKEACRYCLHRRGFSRICEAMLSLEVQCEQEMLGKVYGVLGKRRVRVLDEGLREGTSMFLISCHLPLADSFGLALDIRSAASGHVSFHCAFSHWERSDEDPFQEASLTAQEVEDLGDQPLIPNTARKLIDAIRKRKGLPTDEKVVAFASSKQRTVTRMK